MLLRAYSSVNATRMAQGDFVTDTSYVSSQKTSIEFRDVYYNKLYIIHLYNILLYILSSLTMFSHYFSRKTRLRKVLKDAKHDYSPRSIDNYLQIIDNYSLAQLINFSD